MQLLNHKSSAEYLQFVFAARGQRSGIKAKAAVAMDTQPAFLSRILAGQATLSLEQADKLSRFIGHDSVEHHYFLLLIQYERAGTEALRNYFRDLMAAERARLQQVSAQIQPSNKIDAKFESRYYSSWIYGAIHVLLSIERFQTAPAIARALSLSLETVQETLRLFTENGLAKRDGDRFVTGHVHLHLKNDSDHIQRHHSNWRMKSVETLARSSDSDVRYSAALTLNEETATQIKSSLIKNLRQNLDRVEKAPAETAYIMNIDFVKLT